MAYMADNWLKNNERNNCFNIGAGFFVFMFEK